MTADDALGCLCQWGDGPNARTELVIEAISDSGEEAERAARGDLKDFRQWHSKTPGHPEVDVTPGVETTTGPLGQGIATAVGFALAERMLNAEYGNDLVDHYTYVLASDGDA